MIRALLKRDFTDIKIIHEKFYQKEFDFSELNKFMCSFVSVDNDDKPIVAGGIRTIVEAIIVTDKDRAVEERINALREWLDTARKSTKDAGYLEITAFVQDDKWYRHLLMHGFNPTVGKSLVTQV